MKGEELVKEIFESLPQEYLFARVGGKIYAFEKEDVREVIPAERISRVPSAPPELVGMVFHGGMVIPVFDLKKVFAEEVEGGEKDMIMILAVEGLRAGVLVEGVPEMVEIPTSSVMKSEEQEDFISAYISAEKGEAVPCVDVRALLTHLRERVK